MEEGSSAREVANAYGVSPSCVTRTASRLNISFNVGRRNQYAGDLPTNFPLAYMAGFVDGEGSIRFSKNRGLVYPTVLIVNTNRRILDDFQCVFGGDIHALSRNHKHTTWKTAWSWRISWSKAVDFLELIYPFLRIKREQVHTVFAWEAIRFRSARKTADRESIDLLVERMHWLNRRGVRDESPDPIDRHIPPEYLEEGASNAVN